MSGLYGVLSWLVYGLAAVVMLAGIASAVLAGLALRFVAESLRELVDDPEEGESPDAEGPRAG